jgi:hypothetical protein
MESLINEHLNETELIQGEFARVQELMEEKYKQLEARFSELQDLYDNRPSRPEDLEMLRQMQEQLIQKDNLLKKAAEDMKFYKLELVNREENFNKIFGANPQVGVINPLQGKVSQITLYLAKSTTYKKHGRQRSNGRRHDDGRSKYGHWRSWPWPRRPRYAKGYPKEKFKTKLMIMITLFLFKIDYLNFYSILLLILQ